MKHMLQRLVDLGSFDILQKKLERWLGSYSYNTFDQNVERCLEVIELNYSMQSQLSELLWMSADEGGRYGGGETLKKRLLPWLSNAEVFAASGRDDATLTVLSHLAVKDREMVKTEDIYERTVQDLKDALSDTHAEADQLKTQLEEKSEAFDALKRQSSNDKVLTETGIQQLRDRIRFLEDELMIIRSTRNISNSREYVNHRLKEESSPLLQRKPLSIEEDPESLRVRKSYNYSDEYAELLRTDKLTDAFNDLSTIGRLDAEKVLRRYTDDRELVHRIIFAVMQESFSVVRVAFLEHKMRVRSTLSSIHSGPESLECAVLDYINRHPDTYDLHALSSEVVRGLNRRSGLCLSPGVSFVVIHSFIREACKLAWAMNALESPLEFAPAASLELYDSSKYRRSYDSDYEAGLVAYHIWPCLMQEHKVLVKGEAHTARASSITNFRNRSPNRSETVAAADQLNKSRSPYRTRSRSASPRRRVTTSPKLDDASCQSRTTSSSLSHYGIYS